MSVRRLAETDIQPPAFAFSRANGRAAKDWIRKYPKGREASAVIPLLMLAQDQEGWVTKAAIEHVAEMLAMPLIRVLEVATFYTQFMLAPVGKKAHVQVCGTTPCMLRGSEELIALCRKKIHPEPLHPNAEGSLSWEEVECQGACVNAPMVMIGRDTYEDLTVERLETIIDAFEAGKGGTIQPGPQVDRTYSAPEGGLTSLTREITVESGGSGESRTDAAAGDTPEPTKAARPDPAAKEADPTLAPPDEAKGPGELRKSKSSRTAHTEGAGPTLTKPEAAAAADGDSDAGRPEPMAKPDRPDDLKRISGVGPKIERLLNDLGVYTYRQIADWTEAERDWVDRHLRFKGRIDRDDWAGQAAEFAGASSAAKRNDA